MKRSIFYIACASLVLFVAGSLRAQTGAGRHGHHLRQNAPDAPAIVVRATVDRQQIVVGQPVHLALEATVPGNATLVWPILDSLEHFEWLDKGRIDTIARAGEVYYRQNFVVTSFDSGSRAIPVIPFQSGQNLYQTDSIRIEVGYSKFDPNQDFHDIKDIVDLPNPYARWIPWIIGMVTVISLGLVIWLVRRKKLLKKLVAGVRTSRLSPYEDAVRQLKELEKQGFGFADQEAVKAFYTRLSDIQRMYLFREKGIRSLAETSEELIREMRSLPLETAEYDQLAETLRLSDFVKFAKYQPGVADNERSHNVVRAAIERLNRNGQQPGSSVAAQPVVRGRDNMPVKKDQ